MDDVLKDRIGALQTSREIALAALDRARSASRPMHDVSPSAVDRIEVADRCIRIMGRKDVLEQAVLAEGGTAAPVVHSFVPKWRARQDLNLRPQD